jgi:Ni,Fe-hydrogenase III large subunit
MALADLQLPLRRLAAPLPMWHVQVDAAQWGALAANVAQASGRLVSMWGSAGAAGPAAPACDSVHAAFATAEGLVWAELPVASGGSYPDLVPLFACAARLQRAVADLSGLHAQGALDQRPWLDHGLWSDRAGPRTPPLAHPASCPAATGAPPGTLPAEYPFVRVEGDGVHEIAVGPVHAGIIEPGHFRFSAVGEKVLRLEQHLGYKHKGIELRFTQLPPLQAHRLAGRVSGDSTVAFAWAYCMALETACGTAVPPRALWLRALMLERERVANHLGDLGALGNDAAFAFGLSQFSRLREDWQRLSMRALGHRFMMDRVLPGGVAADLSAAMRDEMRVQCDSVEREVHRLRHIYDEHAGLQDRFMTTGRVTPELAARLGLAGMAGRASGLAHDLRCNHAWLPYAQLRTAMATQQGGDVAARLAVRFDEAMESLRLIRELCAGMPLGAIQADVHLPAQAAQALGWVEGWRGEVLVALQLSADGRITRCHCHDPSWQNWPVLEHAVIGNIVPDFPIINKSFNLSYSGHDL